MSGKYLKKLSKLLKRLLGEDKKEMLLDCDERLKIREKMAEVKKKFQRHLEIL